MPDPKKPNTELAEFSTIMMAAQREQGINILTAIANVQTSVNDSINGLRKSVTEDMASFRKRLNSLEKRLEKVEARHKR
jgi:ABC-type transporter Mla subunit MlaD